MNDVLPMFLRERPLIAVYIMASGRNGTLYTGVTSNLLQRVISHKQGRFAGFSAQYDCKSLVWFEVHAEMLPAIHREKRIKRWKRGWKLDLIEADNPQWRDLADSWFDTSLPYLALTAKESGEDLVSHIRDPTLAGR